MQLIFICQINVQYEAHTIKKEETDAREGILHELTCYVFCRNMNSSIVSALYSIICNGFNYKMMVLQIFKVYIPCNCAIGYIEGRHRSDNVYIIHIKCNNLECSPGNLDG